VRATRSVLSETGVRSRSNQFVDLIKDVVDKKELLANEDIVKESLTIGSDRRWGNAPSTVLNRQASILSQFGKMKGQQWVIIPTLDIIKMENVDNLSLGLAEDTPAAVWAEIDWNEETVATTDEVRQGYRTRAAFAEEERKLAEQVCYNCHQPGHWKTNCPLLNDNLLHMKAPVQPFPIGAQQSLPSTKTGDSNRLTIRVYARGTGIVGYSRSKGNRLAKNSFRMSPSSGGIGQSSPALNVGSPEQKSEISSPGSIDGAFQCPLLLAPLCPLCG